MFWRSLRGMTPHKTSRGAAALQRLKVFEGIPYPYDVRKRMVVPEALKAVRIKAHRNTCLLGELSSHFGWERGNVVATLEQKRIAQSARFHEMKSKKLAARAKQQNDASLKTVNAELAKHGY